MPHSLSEAMENPVYRIAREEWNAEQTAMILKGTQKYDKPLDWRDWTPEELVRHSRQELVDGNHYLTCIDLKMKDMENDIRWLLNSMGEHENKVDWDTFEAIRSKYEKDPD